MIKFHVFPLRNKNLIPKRKKHKEKYFCYNSFIFPFGLECLKF